ncbi:hypothetical protein TNIN_198701 [Trichonephila inaurata madagascariensis]|uniref:Uncharacterized protein n=1 Tax=Trichonephila inaurata madagascariensis TaxID=2747483 RepID=A0A8X6YWP2_9ARAC|nr:hypothetical protein TNIN_198701 [Trichonephila inaurata madagascariensis]
MAFWQATDQNGDPPTTEPVVSSTYLPFYDADLDITDPTYLKQGSSASTPLSFQLEHILFLIGLSLL